MPRVILVALIATSALALWSAAMAASALYGQFAEVSMAAAHKDGGHRPDGSHLDLKSLEAARWLSLGAPAREQRLAEALERRALAQRHDPSAAAASLAQAAQLYRVAARKRPTWPFSGTPLLRVRLKQAQLGAEYDRLFRHSVRLGRDEPAAQRALVDIGLAAWPFLGLMAREDATLLLGLAMERQSSYVRGQAQRLGRLEVLETLGSTQTDPAVPPSARGRDIPRR